MQAGAQFPGKKVGSGNADGADGIEFAAVIKAISDLGDSTLTFCLDAGTFAAPVYRHVPFTPGRRLMSPLSGAMGYGTPAAMACALRIIRTVRETGGIRTALEHEYRYTARSMSRGDFLEGIRAAIMDRDGAPRWRHETWRDIPEGDILAMTAPITDHPLQF